MNSKPNLYFLALIPPEPWREKVTGLKKEFAAYNSHHALKSPPHITLIPPFKMISAREPELMGKLDDFSVGQQQFSLHVGDFGAFKPRVIFLDIEISDDLIKLNAAISERFSYLVEDNSRQKKRFHPHMTIAFRDLTKPMFHKAWEDYHDKKFSFTFEVNALYLLKHNGKFWNVLQASGFAGSPSP